MPGAGKVRRAARLLSAVVGLLRPAARIPSEIHPIAQGSAIMIDEHARKPDPRTVAGILSAYRDIALQHCLVPECKLPSIKAHSIQEARVLQLIGVDGHIYMFQPGPSGTLLSRIGVHRASRFTGFCAQHDNDLFTAIDLDDRTAICVDDMEQAVRLSLRAVACEYWKKLNSALLFSRALDLARGGKTDEVREWLNCDEAAARFLVDSASQYTKPRLDGTQAAVRRIGRLFLSLLHQVRVGKYHLSQTCTLSFAAEPRIAVASHFPIEYDLGGRRLALRRQGEDTPEVTLNVVPTAGETLVLFLWHRRFEPVLRPFFNDLLTLPLDDLQVVLSQMLINHCENVAISPHTIDRWNDRQKAAALDLFQSTMYRALPYGEMPRFNLFVEGPGPE